MNAKITPFERDQDDGWKDAHKGFTVNSDKELRRNKEMRARERKAFKEVEHSLAIVDIFLKDLRKAIQQWGEEVKND